MVIVTTLEVVAVVVPATARVATLGVATMRVATLGVATVTRVAAMTKVVKVALEQELHLSCWEGAWETCSYKTLLARKLIISLKMHM